MDEDELTPIIKELTKPKNLTATFADLKRTYFPGWDKANEWKIRVSPGLKDIFSAAELDSERKNINIVPEGFQSADRLRSALLFGICHAMLLDRGHKSKIFQRKVLQTIEKAQQIGQQSVADELRKELEYCLLKPPNRISFRRVILDAQDLLKQGPLYLDEVIASVAGGWGCDEDELLQRYPVLKKAIRKIKREITKRHST